MIRISAGVEIDRPAEEVFDYLSDFSHNPDWQRGMVSARWTSPPPRGVGSTYEQVARFLGRDVLSRFVVTDHVPGRSVTIRSTSGSFPITVTRRVEAIGPGRCRVVADVAGDPSGYYRIAAPLMRLAVRRSVQSDYRRLKATLEGSASEDGAGRPE